MSYFPPAFGLESPSRRGPAIVIRLGRPQPCPHCGAPMPVLDGVGLTTACPWAAFRGNSPDRYCRRCRIEAESHRLGPQRPRPVGGVGVGVRSSGPSELEKRIAELEARLAGPQPPAPEPEPIAGARFDLGAATISRAVAREFGLLDSQRVGPEHVFAKDQSPVPTVEELLLRHVRGDFGSAGTLDQANPRDKLAAAGDPRARRLNENAVAIQRGQGTVRSGFTIEPPPWSPRARFTVSVWSELHPERGNRALVTTSGEGLRYD